MRKFLVLAAASGLLAACGGGADDADADGDGKITMAEAADKARDATIRPKPGQYRATMEVVDFEVPGAPPQAKDMMKQMMGRSFEYCLSQEDADKGFEEMAKESQDGNCSFEKFDIDGGKMDAVMVCSGDKGEPIRMTMDGMGTETSSKMTMTMDGAIPGYGAGKMIMKTSHQRIGDCPS